MFMLFILVYEIILGFGAVGFSVGRDETTSFRSGEQTWFAEKGLGVLICGLAIVLSFAPICSVLMKSRAYNWLVFFVISNLVVVAIADCSKDGYCMFGDEQRQLTLDDCLKFEEIALNDSVCFVSDVKEGCNWTERVAVEPRLAWLEFCLDLEDVELLKADQKWLDRKFKAYDKSTFARKLVVLRSIATGIRARYSSVGLKGVGRMLSLYRYVCARQSYVWPVIMDYLLVGKIRDVTYIEFKADLGAVGPAIVERVDWHKLSACAVAEIVVCYALVLFGPKSVRQHKAWLLISAITIGVCVSVWCLEK